MRAIKTLSSLLLGASALTAQNHQIVQPTAPKTRGYVRAELGGSFTGCTTVCAPEYDWTAAPQGYNSSFGNSPLSGFGLGMYVNRWLAIGLSAQNRPNFSYCKSQTPPDGSTENPCNFFPSLDCFNRQFDLSNTSYMIDLFLNRSGDSSWFLVNWGGFKMAPYLGGSIGLSTSWVSNFRTTTDIERQPCPDNDYTIGIVRTVMTAKSFNKLGWQVQAGIDFPINETVTLGIGYRYFSGGTLHTNDYAIDPIGKPPETRDVIYSMCPWSWKLRANELVISLSLSI